MAARGIDIPNLDYVINFHFPGSPKLFVHRVGRCARAGRSGTAFTLFSNEDAAHLLDLQVFLDRPIEMSDNQTIGIIPNDLLEDEHMDVKRIMDDMNIVRVPSSELFHFVFVSLHLIFLYLCIFFCLNSQLEWCFPNQSKCIQEVSIIETCGLH